MQQYNLLNMHAIQKLILRYLILIIIVTLNDNFAVAQANIEVFGQNRIQHRKFDWKYYDAKHFKIHHYDRAGRELARYVAEQAEQDIAAVERRLGGLFPDKVNIILYNSYDHYDQSNIGLNTELHLQNQNSAGTLNVVGDKIVIYFTGNHENLKKQLREGMAQVVMERLMFGENFREIIRNIVLLNLPEWVTEGYIDYVVSGWTPIDDNDWKNLVDGNEKQNFEIISQKYPRLAGKAFWKYISTKYGESNVRNLLYLTQLKSSLNTAVKLTIGQNLKTTYDSLIVYYQNRYIAEETLFDKLDTINLLAKIEVPKGDAKITKMLVSPRGSDVAYLKWENGEVHVILEKINMEDGKRKPYSILTRGVKNHNQKEDPNYPLLAWSNTGYKLGIIFQQGANLRMRVYDSRKLKIQDFKIPANRFDRITSFTFMEDDDMIILSAIKNGQSDLYEYRMKRARMTQLTDDAWDDETPVFVSGGTRKGIVFMSNRPAPYIDIAPLPNELPTGPMNAFFYNATIKSYDLLQLTRESKSSVMQVIPYGMDNFAYLSEENGVRNRYVVLFARDKNNRDSAYSIPVTNFGRSILFHQYNPASQKVADVLQTTNTFDIYFRPAELPAPFGNLQQKNLQLVEFIDGVVETENKIYNTLPINLQKNNRKSDKKNNNKQTDTDNPQNKFFESNDQSFQSEFNDDNKNEVVPRKDSDEFSKRLDVKNISENAAFEIAEEETITYKDGKRVLYVDSTFIEMRSIPYFLTFKPDFFSARMDNSILFNKYQSYGTNTGRFDNQPVGAMFVVSMFDKMEDYRFTGGLRIPANFSGNTYYLEFNNYRKRIDWGLTFFRQVIKNNYNFSSGQTLITTPGRSVSNIIQGNANLPLDKVKSVRMHLAIRQDNMILKAAEYYGLALPNVREHWAMSKIEFVNDDTRNPFVNIWNGSRYKIFAEYMYKLHSNNEFYSKNGMQQTKFGGLYNIGFDVRHYMPLYRSTIGAVRLAGAHSGGLHKIMYSMGGVDNALMPKYSSVLQPSSDINYGFQTLANTMRGYKQNARNGNTFIVLNTEIRIPIINTFFNRPVQSPILKHLQLVPFLDVGSSWEGLFPDKVESKRGAIFTWPNYPQDPNITVNVANKYDQGIAMGFGAGLRTMIFGYFIRMDAAMNIRRDFMLHFAIGTDF